jgi:hypothetical protein
VTGDDKVYTLITLDREGVITDVETLDRPPGSGLGAPAGHVISVREGHLNGGDSVEIELLHGPIVASAKQPGGSYEDVTIAPAWSETTVQPALSDRRGWTKSENKPDVVGVARRREYYVWAPHEQRPTWRAYYSGGRSEEDGAHAKGESFYDVLRIFPVPVQREFIRAIESSMVEKWKAGADR